MRSGPTTERPWPRKLEARTRSRIEDGPPALEVRLLDCARSTRRHRRCPHPAPVDRRQGAERFASEARLAGRRRRGGGGPRRARAWLRARAASYGLVVATRDWHTDPGTHFSAAPDFVDSWPVHCLAGSPGAELQAGPRPARRSTWSSPRVRARPPPTRGLEGADVRDGRLLDGPARRARHRVGRRGRDRHRSLRSGDRARRRPFRAGGARHTPALRRGGAWHDHRIGPRRDAGRCESRLIEGAG